jgi:hypothetical protein
MITPSGARAARDPNEGAVPEIRVQHFAGVFSDWIVINPASF